MSKILYEGKSKIIMEGEDNNSCILRYKDTATAFNGVKKEELSGKGVLNAAISNLIYGYLTENGIETHLIEVVDEVTALVKKAEIVMVEVIIRNIAAGSFSKKYGVPEGTALKNTTVEFSLKSDELDDPMINTGQITALGLATPEELAEMTRQSLLINKLMSELFEKAGAKIPTTFDELLEASAKLQEAGVKIPLAMGVKEAWQAAFVYEWIALQEVGAVNVNKMLSLEIPFEDAGYLTAAEKVQQLYEAGVFGPNPMEMGSGDADQAFLTGNTAMRMTGNWFTDSIYNDKSSVVADVTTVAQIPVFGLNQPTDYVGGYIDSFFVNKATANPEVAADFTMFLCKEIATARHESGQGFTAFTDPVDESNLQRVAQEVAAIANAGVDGVIAWDTSLDENNAMTHLEAVQSLFTDSGDPQAVYDEHVDILG